MITDVGVSEEDFYRILGVSPPGAARGAAEPSAERARERTFSIPIRTPHDRDDDIERRSSRDTPYAVSDQRWWAQPESEQSADAAPTPKKPTHIERLEAELASKDELMRKYAAAARSAADEVEAAKRRIEREAARELERQRRAILSGFLAVLDDLDRALESARERAQASSADAAAQATDPVLHGIELVRQRFLAVLRDLGVVPIEATGARFDPRRHEALTAVAAATPDQDGVVTAVAREGYMIGEDVLRPAQVVVAQAR